MTATMVHRGPDDVGYHFAHSIGLGLRRLSVIDLEGGHQPMSNEDGSVWVLFNGEIYNFISLRRELEECGHRFRTNSDTEVIVHGYTQWGDDVLQHLNGMFGLAIWDPRRQRLLLARDRLGIKLVYYRVDEDQLLFGSEIRPVLAARTANPEIDPVAMSLFLRYRYTPSPRTMFRGIHKLAAGTCLIAEMGEEPRLERWWKFAPSPFEPMPTEDEAEERLAELYDVAIQRQLISDVPVGLLLSGGMDSALLLALMRKHGESPNSYTLGYGQSFVDDELSDASRTAALLGSPHTPVEISRSIFEETLSKVVRALEEPVATASIVAMYHLCERTRRDVKVALIGQGPDELFGGYKRHLGVRYGSYFRALPKPLRRGLHLLQVAAPRNEAIRRALHSLAVPERMRRYQNVFSIVSEASTDDLFREGLLPEHSGDSILKCWEDLEPLMRNTDELGGFQFLELRSSLPDELLMYTDKISMANSLEVRVPYLDQEIVEYVECLDASFKVRFGARKWLHRRVAKRFLPSDILNRRKRGFACNVVEEWFRKSLSQQLNDLFLDEGSLIYKYLRPTPIQTMVSEHRNGKADHYKLLFSLVVLEQFLKVYSDSAIISRSDEPPEEKRFTA